MCSSYIVIVNTNPHFLTAKMATWRQVIKNKSCFRSLLGLSNDIRKPSKSYIVVIDCDLSLLMDFREKKKCSA